MANQKETNPLIKALDTTGAQSHGGGESRTAAARRGLPGRFTDEELVAARQLVMLSESSSEDVVPRAAASRSSSSASASSPSLPSVSNARAPPLPEEPIAGEDEEEGVEGEDTLTGPRVRRPRYRLICGLYAATTAINGGGAAKQKKKKSRR